MKTDKNKTLDEFVDGLNAHIAAGQLDALMKSSTTQPTKKGVDEEKRAQQQRKHETSDQ